MSRWHMHQQCEREQERAEVEWLEHFGEPMPSGDVDEWIRARREAEAKQVVKNRSVSD